MNDKNYEMLIVNDKRYKVLKLLGKGKGGYSYLAQGDDKEAVVKQIHHEPIPMKLQMIPMNPIDKLLMIYTT